MNKTKFFLLVVFAALIITAGFIAIKKHAQKELQDKIDNHSEITPETLKGGSV